MKNKFYFFLTFLLGMLFVFIGGLAFVYSSYFVYTIVVLLGILIFIDTFSYFWRMISGEKVDIIQCLIRLLFGFIFLLFPQLPYSFVVILFALYICITGMSHFITYCYYRKEKVSGRLIFLLSSILFTVVGISFLLSPMVHTKEMTSILAIYSLYLGLKYMSKSIRELLSENRKNTLKRRIRVSLPIFLVALMPRIVIEYINNHLEIEDEKIYVDGESSLEVLIHVSKDGFGAIGHVDICYRDEVIAYGAYDESSTHLFGAVGDGVLFIADKDAYIPFCRLDDPTSHIFGYTLCLDEVQRRRVEETILDFKTNLIEWYPPFYHDKDAHDYASRLYKGAKAQFYKFKKGQFKYYFVMTTNCVLLADRIIGKSGIDIVNMNGIITPGTYFSYFEEESKKENSRVVEKRLY